MEHPTSIFTVFGGIRPMARKLDEPASNVSAWKRVGRIPADKQPRILEVGLDLGLPVTAELLIFPSGRIPDAVARALGHEIPSSSRPAPSGSATFQGVDRTGGEKYGNRPATFPASGADRSPAVPA